MFLEWNDEKYSQRLSKRVHDGLDTSVKNGTYCGGHHKLIDTDKRDNKGIIHRVAIDEEQAEVVRYIFTEYAKGTPKKEIADELNKRHVLYKGNLVYKVFVYDDHIITYLTFGNDKDVKEISLADNDKAIDDLKVLPLSSLPRGYIRDITSFLGRIRTFNTNI